MAVMPVLVPALVPLLEQAVAAAVELRAVATHVMMLPAHWPFVIEDQQMMLFAPSYNADLTTSAERGRRPWSRTTTWQSGKGHPALSQWADRLCPDAVGGQASSLEDPEGLRSRALSRRPPW